MITTRELLQYSYEQRLSHIPSALSMLDYLSGLFYGGVITRDDIMVIGKPFGAQAYYLIWRDLGWVDNIEQLSIGVKHDEIPFVAFSEETLGNALGVAIGIALTTTKRVWVNLSDAALQMGNILEAVQFIGSRCVDNIVVTVDNNGMQVTGNTADIIRIDPCIQLFRNYGWNVVEVDGHDRDKVMRTFPSGGPSVVFYNTVKGNGVSEMVNNSDWHYRRIECQQQLEEMCLT